MAKRLLPQEKSSLAHRLPTRLTLSLCTILLAVFLIGDTALRRISQADVTAIKTSDRPTETISTKQGARIHSQILPPASMDARWWVLHTEKFLTSDSIRIRHTDLDNVPEGRDVHWSSGLIWGMAATAHLLAVFAGGQAVDQVTAAAFWVGPILLVACLALLGKLVARRLGWGLAGIFCAMFGASTLIYQCFRAGEADHHGLVCTFATGSVLCLVLRGAGLVRKAKRPAGGSAFAAPNLADARWWFTTSGVLGGGALWISAATFIPILAGCGLGAIGAFFLRDREGSIAAPDLWRRWAVSGCVTSLFFYLLEYFPGHLGWRLEVNHPLYAFAWLGAGDLLARILGKCDGQRLLSSGPKGWVTLVASGIAVALPPLLIVWRPAEFFWVSDRFLLLLHNEFIIEFQSFLKSLRGESVGLACAEMFTWPLVVILGTVLLHVRKIFPSSGRAPLALALVPTLVMQYLAFVQIRWVILSAALWIVCALIVLTVYFLRDSTAPSSRAFQGLFGLAALIAILAFPATSLLALSQVGSLKDHLPKSVIPTVLLRDVAHRLVESSPEKLPVVLSSPNSSTELAYYGGIRTLGTLYWENMPGLKKAAHIFAAPTKARAKVLLAEAQVTHIVAATWDNFNRPYVQLLRQAEELPPGNEPPFIDRLLIGETPPDWLRPLFYPIPAGFGITGEEIHIFRVLPEQTHAEALLHRGIFAGERGDLSKAEELLRQAIILDPQNPTARHWLDLFRTPTKSLKPTSPQ